MILRNGRIWACRKSKKAAVVKPARFPFVQQYRKCALAWVRAFVILFGLRGGAMRITKSVIYLRGMALRIWDIADQS
ncbi:MAG: hypothetical protein J6Q17_02415, partial [Clostridia bacterium]|nr:hypothetical protein [Clostridia bacterium]